MLGHNHVPERDALLFTSLLEDGTRRLGRISLDDRGLTWLDGLPSTVPRRSDVGVRPSRCTRM